KWTYRPPLVELERSIVNISTTLEIISNATTNALGQIQTETEQVSQIAVENGLALDGLFAAQGGVCGTNLWTTQGSTLPRSVSLSHVLVQGCKLVYLPLYRT
uniref:ERVV2 protein n=1 Tax=Anser cygnoides TaxID=8845 RepID=A0A8B9EJU2_ANSCY